ncbi:hypothetical protein FRC01_001454 [Tulasnella sp. 417]|nr:hypothetical protein FRC01_001454 [Tulasnella sp. 417]
MSHLIPSSTPSFLSPDFIHFPGGTPAVPPPPQPQYPSSDLDSSIPSTPESNRSVSSNSSHSKNKVKTRIYDQDPKYPDDALHWHSKHNGKCPDCGLSGGLTKPKWHSQKKRLYIRCQNVACRYWRFTDYYTDPPKPAPSTSTSAAVIPSGTTLPCLAQPCSTGNKRNRNIACANKMCLQDCIKTGRSHCSVHKREKGKLLSGTTPGHPPPVLFQGPSLPSMPSIPPSSGSFLDAAPHPSSPNPANPRSLHDITTSTVKPSLENPFPRPTASPLEVGPTFLEVKRYARELPGDWADVIAAQQSAKAQQMLYEAQFRSHIKEGVSINIVFWRAKLGVAPYLFERVVHAGTEYTFSDDVDLCATVGFDPKTTFILAYLGGMWCHRSPRERHRVKPGSFLFFREAGPVVAYEDPLLRFDELLTLAMDPGFGGASSFLSTIPTAAPSPTGPRPRPRPKVTPLNLPNIDSRYNWITSRFAFATAESSTEPGPGLTPAPSVATSGGSSVASPSVGSSSITSSSTANSSVPSGVGNPELGGSDNSEPKRNWPDDYTVREIHDGMLALTNKGRARRGSGITIRHRFEAAFPNAERWTSGRFYLVKATWESFAIEGTKPQQNALEAWLKTDAKWTDIFGTGAGPSTVKKRNVKVFEFGELE